jgi:predicted TIM-barrel fold metal-dependent hydrolase
MTNRVSTQAITHQNVLVSLDGHTEGFVDFRPYMPAEWRERFEAARQHGKAVFHDAEQYFARLVEAGYNFSFEIDNDQGFDPELYDLKLTPEERVARIDGDGIAAELIIDGFGAITHDPGLAHETTLAFNRWFEDTYLRVAPERFNAAVVVSLIAGVDTVVEEIADAHEHGIAAIHIPGNPNTALPHLPHYNHDMYEPMWRSLDERKMLAIFHASVGREKPMWEFSDAQRANMALEMMTVMRSHETAVAPLLLAGVPERFPNIRFGWIESGCAWVPAILDACDMHIHGMLKHADRKLDMLPTEQWRASCFAAGPIGKADVAVRDRIGVETILFGSDFIHVEGTYPNSRATLTKVLADVSPEDRYAICTGNGARLLHLDLDALAKTPAAQQGWAFADA